MMRYMKLQVKPKNKKVRVQVARLGGNESGDGGTAANGNGGGNAAKKRCRFLRSIQGGLRWVGSAYLRLLLFVAYQDEAIRMNRRRTCARCRSKGVILCAPIEVESGKVFP
ncbi:hypothetical protein KP509_07G025500 [Ceratopteris richardii]|uniref:Uncharacterized protein n=1 Tax=Ceratopteris richardii TaxID=49495 RepID=A0A8T2UAT0_CERRI|nr:hypothetical protein KP509_07G025500 [Ceratopteris richardii]